MISMVNCARCEAAYAQVELERAECPACQVLLLDLAERQNWVNRPDFGILNNEVQALYVENRPTQFRTREATRKFASAESTKSNLI